MQADDDSQIIFKQAFKMAPPIWKMFITEGFLTSFSVIDQVSDIVSSSLHVQER